MPITAKLNKPVTENSLGKLLSSNLNLQHVPKQ